MQGEFNHDFTERLGTREEWWAHAEKENSWACHRRKKCVKTRWNYYPTEKETVQQMPQRLKARASRTSIYWTHTKEIYCIFMAMCPYLDHKTSHEFLEDWILPNKKAIKCQRNSLGKTICETCITSHINDALSMNSSFVIKQGSRYMLERLKNM